VARGVAWAAGAQAVIAIADLLSQVVVVALWIPSKQYGVALAAVSFYTALDYMADLGVTSALIQHDDHTPERVSTVFWFNLLISGGLALVLLGVGPLYGMLQHNSTVGWLLAAYGGKLVLQNVYAIPFALLRKELRFADIAKARVVAHLAESAARIVFAAAGVTVWCWTLAALVRALVFGVIMQARHPFVPRLVFRPREVTQYVRFGIRTAASQVLYQLYTNADQPVIFHFFGEDAAGIYALADQIVLEPVKMIANVVVDVAFPAFARLRNDAKGLVAQFIQLTRLNLVAVLVFVGLIVLVIPDFLHAFYEGPKWSASQLDLAAPAARILCVMGFFRALGFLGPPVLDGVGRPELTLRYMVIAAIFVPTSFVLGAVFLAEQFAPPAAFLSVAVAWAIGYPIAFAALSYLVVRTIHLPVRDYLVAISGVIASCGLGIVAGFVVSALSPGLGHVLHMILVAATSLGVTALLLAYWQKMTPRSVARSLRG
jgi:O-antigen/teichoic acid export membrane protein